MYEILSKVNNFIWGNGLIFLLLVTGLFYTLKLKFIQFRMPSYLVKNIKSGDGNKGISQFKTVCMSLGTSMGTGNITGVAAAVTVGGAGAVFWMWVSAFLGMSLVYAENSLSVIYGGENAKGSLSYIENGFKNRIIAVVFAVFCICCSFGMGAMVQVNAFAESLSVYGINKYITALVIFLIILSVVSGGERISTAAQYLMPAASLFYTVLCIAVMIRFRENILPSFSAIFSEAFGIRQAAGGGLGYAISVGIRRGIFSNEAGLGSSPILHSAAESDNPQMQGMWSMFEVFFDTCVCCTLTALAVLCSGQGDIMSICRMMLGKIGEPFLMAEIGVFSFCTVTGWYYCGESAYRYISGNKKSLIFCIIFSMAAASGAVWGMKEIWTLSDIFNGLMMIPNICALIILSDKVKK